MKKTILKLLCFVLAFSILQFNNVLAETIESGACGENATWTYSNDGTLTINGSGAISNYEYASDTTPWKNYENSIKKVVIGNGITRIGDFSFRNMKNCTSLIIGNNVTEIGNSVFCWMGIKSLTIPKSVKSMGWSAFYGTAIETLTVPSSIKSILKSTFQECKNLKKVVIEEGVTTIAQYAFSMCSSLTEVIIPKTVTSLGYMAFEKPNAGLKIVLSCASKLTASQLSNANVKNYEKRHLNIVHYDKEVFCTKDGHIEHWYCKDCSKYYGDKDATKEISEKSLTISKTKHNIVKFEAKEPSCEDNGNIEYYKCTSCGKYFTDASWRKEIKEDIIIIPAIGHDYVEEVAKEPTCEEKGIKTYICKNNEEHTYTENIEALGHKMVHVDAKESTKKSEGNIEYWHCEVCGKYYSDKDGLNEITFEGTILKKKISFIPFVIGGGVGLSALFLFLFLAKRKKR